MWRKSVGPLVEAPSDRRGGLIRETNTSSSLRKWTLFRMGSDPVGPPFLGSETVKSHGVSIRGNGKYRQAGFPEVLCGIRAFPKAALSPQWLVFPRFARGCVFSYRPSPTCVLKVLGCSSWAGAPCLAMCDFAGRVTHLFGPRRRTRGVR